MQFDRHSSARLTPATLMDWTERTLITLLYLWLVLRLVDSMEADGRIVNGLLLVSEGLVIVFLVTRKMTQEVSPNPWDWLLAVLATCGPLFVRPGAGSPIVPQSWAACVWLSGTLLQVSAKIALGRSFGCIPADRGLKRGGPYRYLRHPMYAGYLFSHVAFLLLNPTAGNLAIYFLCDLVQVPRIFAEERWLGRNPDYRAYCAKVRWRVLPGLF